MIRLRESYGDPAWFVPGLYTKVLAVLIGLAAAVALVAFAIGDPLGIVDLVGMTVTAPVLAYLIHVCMLPWPGRGSADSDAG
jgi:hypothetical protein